MIAIITLLVVILISLTGMRVATVALTLTGMSREVARFQARSAFTGVGFTTAESEQVVNHPVRRRILMILMLMGNAGIVTAISSLILAFVERGQGWEQLARLSVLVVGVLIMFLIARSNWLTQRLDRAIGLALQKWTTLDTRDYASLLRLQDDFTIIEIRIGPDDWVVDRDLAELDLHSEGITVLGIQRAGGGYVGVPTGTSRIHPGDTVVLYGRADAVTEIDQRRSGDEGNRAHSEAVDKERRRMQSQKREESKSDEGA